MRGDELRSAVARPSSRYPKDSSQPRNEALMAKALMAERQQADAWLRGDSHLPNPSFNHPEGPRSGYGGELKSIVQPLFDRAAGDQGMGSQGLRTSEGFPLRQSGLQSDVRHRQPQSLDDAG